MKPFLCIALSVSLLSPAASSQELNLHDRGGFPGTRKYHAPRIAAVDLANSNRLDMLLRSGNLYLSLEDAIALALENNLDVAISRYGPLEAQTDLKRAEAGGALRGVNQAVAQGPVSAAGLSLNAFSSGGNTSLTSSSTGTNGIVSQLGTLIPNYDPQLSGIISWGHTTNPQSTPFLYGTTSLVTTARQANFNLTEGFPTGATATLAFFNQISELNSGRPDLNPLTTGGLTLTVSQPLLAGFGFAVN